MGKRGKPFNRKRATGARGGQKARSHKHAGALYGGWASSGGKRDAERTSPAPRRATGSAPAIDRVMDRYAEISRILNDKAGGTSVPDLERRAVEIFRMRTPVGHPRRGEWIARIRRLIASHRAMIAVRDGKPLGHESAPIAVGATVTYRRDHILATTMTPWIDPRARMRGTVLAIDGDVATVHWGVVARIGYDLDWNPVAGTVRIVERTDLDSDVRPVRLCNIDTPGSFGHAHSEPSGFVGFVHGDNPWKGDPPHYPHPHHLAFEEERRR